MSSFLALLKNKGVIIGISLACFYQIVFVGIFMYGYSAIPKNVDQLTVAIVNEDTQSGQDIASRLQEDLPFHITTELSLEQAREQLDQREIHLIIHIPSDFTDKLSQPNEQVKLDFLINQGNPAMVAQSMQEVANQVTASINAELTAQGIQGTLQGMNVPEDQAKQIAAALPNKLASNIVYSGEIPAGMHNQMAPFFISMASYIGGMIYSMTATGVTTAMRGRLGKWKTFFSLQMIHILVSLFAPIIGLVVYFCIQGGYGAEVFVKMWMNHALEMFAAIQFMSIFHMLLGQKSTFVNIPLMLTQTIACGATLSQEMMAPIFRAFRHIAIMYYTVQADFSIMSGAGKVGIYIMGLALVMLASLLIFTLVYHLKPVKAPAAAHPAPAAAAH